MPTQEHFKALILLYQLLFHALTPEHLVAGEMVLLYDPLSLRHHYMPDLLVALRAGQEDPVFGGARLQYRIWDEGKPPDLVIEAASTSTVEKDLTQKRADYARLGIREYMQFDPVDGLLTPRLHVFQLLRQRDDAHGSPPAYEMIQAASDGSVQSSVLPYDWTMVGNMARPRDRATGLLLPTPEEEARAERDAALDDAARLRAEIARLRGEAPGELP